MKKIYLLSSFLFLIGCTEKTPINIDLLRSSKDHLIYYSRENNEPYTGPVFYLDENDNIFLQGTLKNGQKNGDWIYWDRYGDKIEGIISEEVPFNFTGVMFDFFYYEDNIFVSHISYEKGIKEGKNTVCIRPGKLDRSPCGTGSSARLALMREKNEIDINEIFISRSIIGSEFICKIENEFVKENIKYINPLIKGSAFITGQQELYISKDDPFPQGYRLNDTWPQISK